MNVVLTPSTFQRAPQNDMQGSEEQLELLIQIVKEHQMTIKQMLRRRTEECVSQFKRRTAAEIAALPRKIRDEPIGQ